MSSAGDALPRIAHEGDLWRLWASGILPTGALVGADGARWQVVYPGRRSGGPGPDFRGAILADAAGRVRTGDVELHLRARDWIAHGHRADPAFNGVVLHVVLEDDGTPCVRADGAAVPVLALGGLVAAPLAEVVDVLPEAQPCRVSPALLTADVRAIVRAAGRARLDAKAGALEAQVAALGREQALFAALLDAAGYSRNRAPAARLAARLPVERLQDVLAGKGAERAAMVATAVVLGLSGLLPAGEDAGLCAAWARYADYWSLPPLRPDDWVRAGVRPANRPELRLRGVALLVARHTREGLAASLLASLCAGAGALLAALEVAAPPGERLPPIGRGRAAEMAINVVVPFALAVARVDRDEQLEARAWGVAAALPTGEDTEPARYMRAVLARSGHRLRTPGALEGQGLLHLHRAHCAVHACWECPLAAPETVM